MEEVKQPRFHMTLLGPNHTPDAGAELVFDGQ